jgi:hypothetical protein
MSLLKHRSSYNVMNSIYAAKALAQQQQLDVTIIYSINAVERALTLKPNILSIVVSNYENVELLVSSLPSNLKNISIKIAECTFESVNELMSLLLKNMPTLENVALCRGQLNADFRRVEKNHIKHITLEKVVLLQHSLRESLLYPLKNFQLSVKAVLFCKDRR